MIKQQKAKLEAERQESLTRLKQIEKRLKKTEVTKNLLEDDSSENSEGGTLLSKKSKSTSKKLSNRSALPKKQARTASAQKRMDEKYARGQEEAGCCNGCN